MQILIVELESIFYAWSEYMEELSRMKTTSRLGQKIKCDCCGTETLAEIRDDKIIIMDKRHGQRHIAVLKLADVLAIMSIIAD